MVETVPLPDDYEPPSAALLPPPGPCQHPATEPVVLLTGELVAAVCTSCLAALPPSWGCPDCAYVECHQLADPWPTRVMGAPCPAHRL